MIIGITGTLGAGKGTVAEILKQKGFEHYSVRDFLIEEVKERGLEPIRKNLVIVANQLREIHSPSYIIERLSENAKQESENAIIESIRTPAEVKAIKEKGGYVLAVDADIKIRYSRILRRQTSTDHVTYDEFKENEEKEMHSSDPNKQNLSKCIQMADFVLTNNKRIEDLEKQVNNLYEKLQKLEQQTFETEPVSTQIPSMSDENTNSEITLENQPEKEQSEFYQKQGQEKEFRRPSWDEYFIKIASLVAERSTCLRHNVGAVIVKDKRILTTGYNGAAKGISDCTERGCLRDELGIKSGTRHEICRAIHAEQNAIIQAGVYGTNIRNATMYCTHTPCMICAKMIVNAGIKEIVSYHDYTDEEARDFLKEAGVELRKIQRPSDKINFKD